MDTRRNGKRYYVCGGVCESIWRDVGFREVTVPYRWGERPSHSISGRELDDQSRSSGTLWKTVTTRLERMSVFAKPLAGNGLVGSSERGFDVARDRSPLKSLLTASWLFEMVKDVPSVWNSAIPILDFASIRSYSETSGNPWMRDHAPICQYAANSSSTKSLVSELIRTKSAGAG